MCENIEYLRKKINLALLMGPVTSINNIDVKFLFFILKFFGPEIKFGSEKYPIL